MKRTLLLSGLSIAILGISVASFAQSNFTLGASGTYTYDPATYPLLDGFTSNETVGGYLGPNSFGPSLVGDSAIETALFNINSSKGGGGFPSGYTSTYDIGAVSHPSNPGTLLLSFATYGPVVGNATTGYTANGTWTYVSGTDNFANLTGGGAFTDVFTPINLGVGGTSFTVTTTAVNGSLQPAPEPWTFVIAGAGALIGLIKLRRQA